MPTRIGHIEMIVRRQLHADIGRWLGQLGGWMGRAAHIV